MARPPSERDLPFSSLRPTVLERALRRGRNKGVRAPRPFSRPGGASSACDSYDGRSTDWMNRAMKRETTTRTSGKHHGSLEEVLQERDFAPLLASQARVLFRLINEMESRQSRSWTKRHFSLVREQAHETESYLDDYDARVNKTFTYFAEIVASIRGFATIAHTLRHVHTRFFKYQ